VTFSVVTGKVFSDNTGASRELPILLTESGPLRPLIDYCLSMQRSLAWQEKLVRAVKLFLEYLEVNAIRGEEEWRLFRNFSTTLRFGTIDPEMRSDPSGLYWAGGDAREARFMIHLLSEFFDWLGSEDIHRSTRFNPRYKGSIYDEKIDLLAYRYRCGKSFLGHSWSPNPKVRLARLIRSERVPKVLGMRPPMFPEERFEELLVKGFKVGGRQDYRGMLITLLLFGGGLRVSEPFHLYVADVQPNWSDPQKAFVTVHHPSLGYAPNHWKNHTGHRGSRQEYLATRFGLLPRNLIRGKLHAGWKHPALDEHWYMHLHWFPEFYGEWFLQIWGLYMEQIASIERNHPYAWINLSQNLGDIYTVKQYQKSLQKSIERIGLTFGKVWGTTAHGLRHAYGQRARRGGVNEIVIQRLMHHCSVESQQVYTQPDMTETQRAIREATEKLNDTRTVLSRTFALKSHIRIGGCDGA